MHQRLQRGRLVQLTASVARTYVARRLCAAAIALAAGAATGCGDGNDSRTAQLSSVEITVVEAVGLVGALQLDIRYLGNDGGFTGRGDQVHCEPLVDALVAANSPREDVLKIGLISLGGFRTPGRILRCEMDSGSDLSPQSFEVEVADASTPSGVPIDPAPEIIVSPGESN